MIKNVDVIFHNAVNKSKIAEYKKLSVEEANLMIPSDGLVRINLVGIRGDWKVQQIVKEINTSIIVSEGTTIIVHVFLTKVTKNDYWLLPTE